MPNVPSHVSEESPQKRNDMMPEVPWALVCPNLAKDDFNDFSTHHHYFSIVRNPLCLLEISRESPSERETIVDAREDSGIVGKREWGSLGCVCVFGWCWRGLASMISCRATG